MSKPGEIFSKPLSKDETSYDVYTGRSGAAPASSSSSSASAASSGIQDVAEDFKKQCEEARLASKEDLSISLGLGWSCDDSDAQVIKRSIIKLLTKRKPDEFKPLTLRRVRLNLYTSMSDKFNRDLQKEIIDVFCNAILANTALESLDLGWWTRWREDGPITVNRTRAKPIKKDLDDLEAVDKEISTLNSWKFYTKGQTSDLLRPIFGAVGNIIEQHPSLRELGLSLARLNMKDLMLIIRQLENNRTITDLRIQIFILTSIGAAAITTALTRNQTLINLDINFCEPNGYDDDSRGDYNIVCENFIVALGQALEINVTLESIKVHNLHVKDRVTSTSFNDSLCKNSHLTSIRMSYCDIEISSGMIGKLIANNKILREFETPRMRDWEEKNGEPVPLQPAFSAFRLNTSLTDLKLNLFFCISESLIEIGNFLASNPALVRFTLSSFDEDEKYTLNAYLTLAKGIKNSRLMELSLPQPKENPINEDGFQHILAALQVNRTLTEFSMFNTDKEEAAVESFMQRNRKNLQLSRIVVLLLSFNRAIKQVKADQRKYSPHQNTTDGIAADSLWAFVPVIVKQLIPSDFSPTLRNRSDKFFRPRDPQLLEFERRRQVYFAGNFRCNDSLERCQELRSKMEQHAYKCSDDDKKMLSETQKELEAERLNRLGLEAELSSRFEEAARYYQNAAQRGHQGASENLALLPELMRIKGAALGKSLWMHDRIQNSKKPPMNGPSTTAAITTMVSTSSAASAASTPSDTRKNAAKRKTLEK